VPYLTSQRNGSQRSSQWMLSFHRIYLCIKFVDPCHHNGMLTLLNVVHGQFVVTGSRDCISMWEVGDFDKNGRSQY
jgi:hypothetical protein